MIIRLRHTQQHSIPLKPLPKALKPLTGSSPKVCFVDFVKRLFNPSSFQMQLKISTVALFTLGASVAAAQSINLCGTGCPSGETCTSYNISNILNNSQVKTIFSLIGIPVPVVPADTTIPVGYPADCVKVPADTPTFLRLAQSLKLWQDYLV